MTKPRGTTIRALGGNSLGQPTTSGPRCTPVGGEWAVRWENGSKAENDDIQQKSPEGPKKSARDTNRRTPSESAGPTINNLGRLVRTGYSSWCSPMGAPRDTRTHPRGKGAGEGYNGYVSGRRRSATISGGRNIRNDYTGAALAAVEGGKRPEAAKAGTERDKMPQTRGRRGPRCRSRAAWKEGDKTEPVEDSRCWIG